ncbi:DNA primase [Streptomyces sp. KM273126]|uniref:DNA primase n=1 Tax=Streptomyces sp. KM273126 TaxID=2545247 RepID=UPI00103EA034|nr:DNA primase [Streptomyces sp. KM273126]MBA2810090.1 DNA primase [Streptomyces sp. KM273126]
MNRVGLGLAVGAGYVLGRTKKMKLAFALGTLVAGKRMHLSPRALADLASQQLQNNPQLKEISDQLREDARGAGQAATGALLERQIDGLADRLHGRTAQVREQLAAEVTPDVPGADAEEERDEIEETEEEPREREERDEGEARDAYEGPEEESEEGREEEPSARKGVERKGAARAGTARKAAARKSARTPAAEKASAKKPAAKKTAGRRTTAQKGSGKRTAAAQAAPRKDTREAGRERRRGR